jgi:hypothetical protein
MAEGVAGKPVITGASITIVLVRTGFVETTLSLYPVPEGVFKGMVACMVAALVEAILPITVGVVNCPAAFES